MHSVYWSLVLLQLLLFTPPPTGAHPGQDLFYLPVLRFLKYILIFQGGFTWYFAHLCITLNQINPRTIYSFLLPCFPIIQQLTKHLYYIHTQMQSVSRWFTLSFSFLLPHSPLRQSHYYNHILSKYVYIDMCMYIRSYIYLGIHLSFRSSFYIQWKTCNLSLLSLAYCT
jgi:hypothetical protein